MMKMQVVISGNTDLLSCINDFIDINRKSKNKRWFYVAFCGGVSYLDQLYAEKNELYIMGDRSYDYGVFSWNSKNMYTFNLFSGDSSSDVKKIDDDSIVHYYSALIVLLLSRFRSLIISIKIDHITIYPPSP